MKFFSYKFIIIIILSLVIAVMPFFGGYQQARASFVPFIVENAEWLLAILAGFGISFATESDALAGVHDFAYNLDTYAYDTLQNYIENQKLKNATKLVIADLLTGGLLTDIKDYIENLPLRIAAAGGQLLIDYLESDVPIEGTINGDYISYNIYDGFTFSIIVPEIITEDIIYWKIDNNNYVVDTNYNLKTWTVLKSNISPGIHTIKLVGLVGTNLLNVELDNENMYHTIPKSKKIDIYNVEGLVCLPTADQVISHLLNRENGDISIDENIGALPLPSEGISSPWDDTIIVPPKSVSEGVRLSPQDVLQAPAIDKFGNKVLDHAGNPVYEPVTDTWPNTDVNVGNPPWELAPDIEGVTEGLERAGGVLETIRDFIGNIGSWLLGLPALIASLFTIPEDIEINFNSFEGIIIHEKFPFSLPWDFKRVISRFQAPAEAPYWELPILGEVIEIDFSIFSQWANIVRVFLSIIYIVILVIITKRFLG